MAMTAAKNLVAVLANNEAPINPVNPT
jgi:hypothetical protein